MRAITNRTSRVRVGCPLYGWVLGAGLSVACGGAGVSPADEPPSLDDRAAVLLSQAIRIDTTNPPGNERALAEWLGRTLDAEGLETRVVPLPDADSSRAALWARLPGAGTARPLILLSHLDVVPADARDWTMDPFAGVVGGGYVIGRGALDAKGVTVTHALALVEAKRRGLAFGRDLILLATPDEEAGGGAAPRSSSTSGPTCWATPAICSPRAAASCRAKATRRTSGASRSPRRRRAGSRSPPAAFPATAPAAPRTLPRTAW